LEGRENVLEVVAYVGCLYDPQSNFSLTRHTQIEGKLESTFSEAGGGTHQLIKERFSLWTRPCGSHNVCPGELPFGFMLPSYFKHNNENIPLPSSYLQHFVDVPTLFLKVSYQLRFIITRVPYKRLGIWHQKKRYVCCQGCCTLGPHLYLGPEGSSFRSNTGPGHVLIDPYYPIRASFHL
jgi:hypothetical protein